VTAVDDDTTVAHGCNDCTKVQQNLLPKVWCSSDAVPHILYTVLAEPDQPGACCNIVHGVIMYRVMIWDWQPSNSTFQLSSNLSLYEAIDVAQNHPLWRLLEHSRNDDDDECYFGCVKLNECVCAKNMRLDDEAVLENISVTEPVELTTSLTGTQQALLLALWSVILLSQSYHKSLLSK